MLFAPGSLTCFNKHLYLQQDTESDNHSENVILTKEDQKIIQTVSELLGIEAEQLKQVSWGILVGAKFLPCSA